MPPVNTRECTAVFTSFSSLGTVLEFTIKPVPVVSRFYQRVFKSDDRHQGDPILAALSQMLEEELVRKRNGKKERRGEKQMPRFTRKEKVNKKREFIKRVISHQTTLNLERGGEVY